MGETERRKALVFVMALVLVVLAVVTLAITTASGDETPSTSVPESIAVFLVSSASTSGGLPSAA